MTDDIFDRLAAAEGWEKDYRCECGLCISQGQGPKFWAWASTRNPHTIKGLGACHKHMNTHPFATLDAIAAAMPDGWRVSLLGPHPENDPGEEWEAEAWEIHGETIKLSLGPTERHARAALALACIEKNKENDDGE